MPCRNFLPTAYDAGAHALVGSVVNDPVREAVASERLVACRVIESQAGSVVVLENWTGKPIPSMTLTMKISTPAQAELASGAKLQSQQRGGATVFTFDMDISGDVLILR